MSDTINIKAGDKVIRYMSDSVSIETVALVTDTQIILDGGRTFDRQTGRGDDSTLPTTIVPYSAERLLDAKRATYLSDFPWRRMSHELLLEGVHACTRLR